MNTTWLLAIIIILSLGLVALLAYQWRIWQVPIQRAQSTNQAVEQIAQLTQTLMYGAQSADTRARECEKELADMRVTTNNLYSQVAQLQRELNDLLRK